MDAPQATSPMYYVDSKTPHWAASGTSFSLTASLAVLTPSQNLPNFGNNYFGFPGKLVRITALGQATSAATPGALTLSWYYGNGQASSGVYLGGVSLTWAASQANCAWFMQHYVRCWATGSSGLLYGQGWLELQNTGAVVIPPSGPGSQTCDLTVPTAYIYLQTSRSGSTAETIQLHDLLYEALN